MRTARILTLATLLLWTGTTAAEPLDLLTSWEGTIDYFIIGAPLAIDGSDSGTDVDTLSQPASVDVTATDVPPLGTIVAAYLFWGGTIPDQSDCATAPVYTDDEVVLTVPGGTPTTVTADECFCEIGAGTYDIQSCRYEFTTMLTSGIVGTYTVDEFAALIRNRSTDNASFAIVLVYDEPSTLPPRRVALYDGLEELYLGSRIINLSGLDVDTPAVGDLAWYVLDGDVGGAGPESVVLSGAPGGASTTLFDSINPATNPMNRTINTTSPPLTDVVGVDVDRLDASAGLTSGDVSVVMTYTAGGDKYWVILNIVGINVYKAHIPTRLSSKRFDLHIDADSSGTPTPGDTIRYTIHLVNVGTAPGLVDVTDDIPSAFESWTLVDAAGGTDASTATRLIIEDVPIPVDGSADIVFDAVIGPDTDGEMVVNVVAFDATPDGNAGTLPSPPFTVGGAAPDDDPDSAPEEAPEPSPEPSPEPAPDAATDPSADTPSDPTIDVPAPPGDEGTGCGCSLTATKPPAAMFLLLLLALALLRKRR
ncbi:MAG: MYXO-CTERM sorting domain-containing protein [Deltaproteobacteria bacterium]|nr:MYXO-CTERM sorting domain-containing protein [Deltaproteobacteria bacterium]